MSAKHLWLPAEDMLLERYALHGRSLVDAAKQIGVTYEAAYSRHYRLSGKTRIGVKRRLDWNAEQVAIVRSMVAEGRSDVEIGKRLGISSSAVEGARFRRGIVRPPKGVPVPEGFVDYAPAHTRAECARHYGVSTTTVARWFMLTKAESRKHVEPVRVVSRPANTPAQGSWRSPPPPQRDGGEVGDAMLVLQQAGMAVYRLRVIKQTAPADMWVVGSRKMHETEMLALAKTRYGMRAAA